MEIFTAKQIADAMDKSVRGIRKRAQREEWPFTMLPCNGGEAAHYAIADLPTDVTSKLQEAFNKPANKAEHLIQATNQEALTKRQQSKIAKQESIKRFAACSESKKLQADVTFSILNLAYRYEQDYGSRTKGWETLVSQYNSGDLELPEHFRKVKKSISYKTLSRWHKDYTNKGITALIPGYGKRKGTGIIDGNSDMKDFCIALVHQFPHIKGARLSELLEMQFGTDLETPKPSTCRKWLSNWKSENRSVFLSLMDPSGWQNKHMAAFGSLSAEVERINQLWEFDSTPADVMLTDGRFSIIGVIDVYTRRVKVVLKPTSNSEGIALLIRDAILDWGVPETARTDNGQDYLSSHITSIWDSLDIHNDITNPYSGWEKPFIERFFRTFSHGIAEMLGGYIGHNVADREKINARLTFAERLMAKREKGAGNENIDVGLSSDEFEAFINAWLDAHYHHAKHSELGCTPFEKFTQHQQSIKRLDDTRILDILLAPVPNQKGFRTVSKEGISVEGMTYIHAELGALVGDRVFCRYNPDDIGRIYVFESLHMRFICEAVNPELAGNEITMAHAQEAKRIQRAKLRESRKQVRQAAKKHDVSDAAQRFIEFRASQTGTLSSFPKASQQVSNDKTHSIAQIKDKPTGFTDEQKNRFAQRREELDALKQSSAEPSFRDENHKARYFTEQAEKGLLGAVEKAWLHKWRSENKAAASMLDRLYQKAK